MAAKRDSKRKSSRPLHVGDRVSFEFGGRRVTGLVIEDRGNLGYQGARLLAVRVPRTDADDVIVEMTADELQAA